MAFNLSALTAQQQAAAIYIGYYDRAPDPYGMDFWEAAVRNPLVSLVEIATYFSAQEETYAVHPFFVTPSASAANVFISELYLNLFNRSPDMAGLTFWSGVLQQSIDGTGPLSVGEIILAIIEGAQNSAEGQDITTLLNKIEVANAWTDGAEAAGLTAPNSYGDSEIAQASAKSIINDVTFASSSVDTAKAEITSTFENFVDGSKFTLTADAPSILEGDNGTKVLVFKATLDEAPTQAISVNYETLSSGTAASGDDFTAVAGAVTFAPGQTVATVSVTVLGDATFEADETIEVKFSGARLTGDVTATGTITNDDIDPQVALGAAYTAAKATYDAAVAAAATSSAAATAAQTAADLAETAVNSLATANAYSTAAQAAQTAAVAAQADAAAVVTAAAAVQAAAAATLSIADDADVAGVSATALAAKAAADTVKSVADAEVANAVAQIANYTGQTYTLSTSSPSITEGDTGTKNLTFTLTLDEAPTKAITINYQTLNSGTATAGDDFNVAAGSVEFAAGQTVATVSVIINADTDFEGDETVQVQFSGDALDAAVTATGTITENDVDPDTVSQTFTLTTSIDNVQGTVNADTIVGVYDNVTATNNTLSAGDVINGSAGTDTFRILANDVNAADDVIPLAGVSNIENFFVRNIDGTNEVDVNAGSFTGEAQLWSDRSTTAVEFIDAGTGTVIGMKGDGSTTNGNIEFSYATNTDPISIAIDGGTKAGNITRVESAATSATISSTGVANTVGTIDLDNAAQLVTGLTINAATDLTATLADDYAANSKITVSGAASKVDIDGAALGANVSEVDASGLTAGGVHVEVGDGGVKVTGGAGNDQVNLQAFAQTADIALGAGDADLVEFTVSTNYAASASKISGAEILKVSGVGSTYAVNAITGISAVQAQTTPGTLTLTGLAEAQNVTVLGNVTTLDLDLSTVAGTNSAKVTIDDDATTAAAITIGDITIASVETLDIVSGDTLASGTAHVVSDFDGSTALTTVNVSGTSDLTLTDISDLASGAKVEASSFSKILTVGGIGAGDTVNAGTGADKLSIAFGNLGTTTKLVGGTGDDTLTVTGNGSDIVDGDFAQLSGIDNLVIGSATGTTVTLSGFAQNSIGTVDANSDGRLDLTATALTTTSTIDGSNLVAAGLDVVTTLTNVDAAGAQTLTVNGSAVADTFVITADDTADAGGDDNIITNLTAGGGIDIITYTATATDANDVLTIVSTATSAADADIITGFAGNSAATLFDYNGTIDAGAVGTVSSNADLNTALATGGAGTFALTTDIANSGTNTQGSAFAALLASNASNLSANYEALEAQLLATGGALNGTFSNLDTANTNGQSSLLVLDNGTGSIVLRHTNSTSTANTYTADELELVGVFTNATGIVTADFI